MKNTLYLDSQSENHIVLECGGSVHSSWSKLEDARKMCNIMNYGSYSYVVESVVVDEPKTEKRGVLVVIELSSGKISENGEIDCLIGEGTQLNKPINFWNADVSYLNYDADRIKQIMGNGNIPRKVNGVWCIFMCHNMNWGKISDIKKEFLSKCTIGSKGETFSEAYERVLNYRDSLLASFDDLYGQLQEIVEDELTIVETAV